MFKKLDLVRKGGRTPREKGAGDVTMNRARAITSRANVSWGGMLQITNSASRHIHHPVSSLTLLWLDDG